MNWMVMVVLLSLATPASAFSWKDLWSTKDQQAKAMMDKGQFNQAKDMFLRDDWRATSSYRAGDYEQAATLYQSFKNEDAYYNQGNALAQMGKYEQAIRAYDKSLSFNPNNQDALHNRKVLEELLKKEKKKEDKQDQDKQNQDKQDQDKQDQDKQNQDKQNQDKQNQDKRDQDKRDQDKQNQDKQNQDKQDQDKQDQDKQNQDKQNQDKQDQDKQDQDKQNQDKQDQDKQNEKKDKPDTDGAQSSSAQREKQRAKEQWLRLIPDDPGGLLREKFRRDHLRRQHGWDQ